ncbi:hypothetical protein [Tardiphaga sp. 709]|uniref:hypothetical protein n=1 Tax=Tardiphaga sp. 709 TaxID=3076039 RepID=UPI0028ED4ED8|nr:hypothetical protein [Tardiphaga sp. 709]WNV09953.1 hypothetical protein RSO67_01790 [Tardiphaga sp. 709]
MILIGHDQFVAEFVSRITGKPFHPPFTAIGIVDEDGVITGGYIFTGYNGDGIELSLAGKGVVHRDGWRAVLSYVFEQLKCSRLQMHTSMKNKTVKRNLSKLFPRGFEGIAKRFYGKHDAVCFALTVDELSDFRARWRL